MRLRTLAASGVSAVALVATTLAPASAANFDTWVNSNNTTVVDDTRVRMAVPSDGNSAYIYNSNLDYTVQAGDVVSFRMDTQQGAYCTDYYPYLYLVIDGRGFSSYDDGTPCPGETTWSQDDGRVNFTVSEDGQIGYIVLYYYDNDGNGSGGAVEMSDVRVNDNSIPFRDVGDPSTDPEPVATPYGATLSKLFCRVRTYAFLDAALEGQVAKPKQRTYITRVDGRVRVDLTLSAGQDGSARFSLRADTGRRMVTVRTKSGELLDRMVVRTGRC
jgi:hypothetical protein